MAMPRWWGQINKRFFNPRAIARGKWPVLVHEGRSSGAEYRTPMDAHPVPGGYLFVPVYGLQSDWVRNVLAAGRARLVVDGREVELTAPRVVGEEVWADVPEEISPPPSVLRLRDFLRMDLVQR
ncbi:nitroreductase family deazaflavin-dependent oxidoreductase [Ruania alkalisoli]|uniref:Nitroreductase family deazaflavin-dependent oxidoreductase n=1 Tax=Ruania alkalisoli TaxID=2779775 RepID=A0A7M1SXE5_9MICO|nr:nitroreductase/quinone reductase family protein [Ruania alkalisoli]QOR71697.1 nitroreductase family deazaflavin-dependent oxidoreductase [Ruania alkalisoli]